MENILETWSNRERSRNGSYAWRHQNEQTHMHWGPCSLFLDCTLDRGPRYATVDPSGLWSPALRTLTQQPWNRILHLSSDLMPIAWDISGIKGGSLWQDYNSIPVFWCHLGVSVNAAFCNLRNSFSNVYKVDRCLARYSPCATTTNQPTNRAPNKPAWPGPN